LSRVGEITAALGGGYLVYAAPARRKLREARNGRTDEERALSKARRWLARKK
jgi:hypothetical protein